MRDMTSLTPGGLADLNQDNEAGAKAEAPSYPVGAGARVNGDDEIHRLEAEIATKRQRVIASLGELRRRVQGATNWRHWVEAHPVLWVCAGVSLGILLGYRGRHNKRRR